MLLGGRAGDLFGRKRLFPAGVALFTAASALNGLASSSAEVSRLVSHMARRSPGGCFVEAALVTRVISQSPHAGTRVLWGAKIDLVIGRGRKS
jgi:MFS family permease